MARFPRFDDVDPSDLIEFAKAWQSMGDAVASQVEAILDDADSWEEQNPNALQLAQDRIGGFCNEIDQALEDALANFEKESTDEEAVRS